MESHGQDIDLGNCPAITAPSDANPSDSRANELFEPTASRAQNRFVVGSIPGPS
jgi:hypothetical protein